MSDHNPTNMIPPESSNGGGGTGVPPVSGASSEPDRLDALLAAWHAANTDRARAGRDRLLASLARSPARNTSDPASGPRRHEGARSARSTTARRPWIRRFLMNRYSPVAAAFIALLVVGVMLLPTPSTAVAQVKEVMAPDGGRLDAVDSDGNVLGPCALKHTDVHADVSGPLVRVTVKQTYSNPFSDKIETVYTFPLSHKAAVDRMTMTIGSRIVQGEVKERELARQMYEAARDAGRIASLLEQQRPNIFTQSVANIEPKAEIVIEISYVELLEPVSGQYSFAFPTVVGPRYIPGAASLNVDEDVRPTSGSAPFPTGVKARRGLVLTAPAKISLLPDSPAGTVNLDWLGRAVNNANPVRPDATYQQPETVATFRADYPDGSAEFGSLRSDGVGEIAGRWFHVPMPSLTGEGSAAPQPGSPFSASTTQVPDAGKITPMPVRPPTRAGHDISISVDIDTGGPGLVALASPSHELETHGAAAGVSKVHTELARANEIPNKDFVLTWSTAGSAIQEGVFTHTGPHGNFFSIILEPPARVEPANVVPRELCFVLDTSGSMSGWPIEKSKELMTKAIAQMRPVDTFNVITFAGATHVLWKAPRPATPANIAEAQKLVGDQQGGGGTEMMKAIDAALEQTPVKGRAGVRPLRTVVFLTDAYVGNDMAIIDAIKKNRGTTRVFSLGIGSSVNRYLIEGMARAGGGESEVVLLDQDSDAAVSRLVRRIQSPVLTDIALDFSGNLAVADVLPADEQGHLPDLYDLRPLVLTGRYTTPGVGILTIRGNTGAGPYERTINVTLPPLAQGSDAIDTLWARAKVDDITGRDLQALQEDRFPPQFKQEIVTLGEAFQIMTPFTSFVAVDKLSVTVSGKPRLVTIPIELPAGTAWEGFFGGHSDRKYKVAKDDDEAEKAPGIKLGFSTGRQTEELKARSLDSAEGTRMRANLSKLGTAAAPVNAPSGAVRGAPAPSPSVSPSTPSSPPPPPPPAPAVAPVPTGDAKPESLGVHARPAAGAGGSGGSPSGDRVARRQLEVNTQRPLDATGAAKQGVGKGVERQKKPLLGGIPVLGQAFKGEAISEGEQYAEVPVGPEGAYIGGSELTERQFVKLLTNHPLTGPQKRLLGIAPDLKPRDQLATGRIPAAQLMIAALNERDNVESMKASAAAFQAVGPDDPSVGELAAISALIEAKDDTSAARVNTLATSLAGRLNSLYRTLKLAQTVDRNLLETVRQLEADKGTANEQIPVIVLIASADAPTLESLKGVGLVTDYTDAERRVIIGKIDRDKLEALALLTPVLRIERDQ
jgi:hypothetical protein